MVAGHSSSPVETPGAPVWPFPYVLSWLWGGSQTERVCEKPTSRSPIFTHLQKRERFNC